MKKCRYILLLVIVMLMGMISVQAAPCKVVKGSGENKGDEISCGTENFYVVKVNKEEIILFAKYNLKVGQNWNADTSGIYRGEAVRGTDVGIQSSDCTGGMGTVNGVHYGVTCSEYATSGDKEKYFNNYYNYLKDTVKIIGDFKVIQPDMEWLVQTGCKYLTNQEIATSLIADTVNCQDSGLPFLYSTSYLLSKEIPAYSEGKQVLSEYPTMEQKGSTSIRAIAYGAGYRPVVTLKKNNIFEEKDVTNKQDMKDENKNNQIVDVQDTLKTSYIGYCLGTIILVMGIMVVYQYMKKDEIEVKIKNK